MASELGWVPVGQLSDMRSRGLLHLDWTTKQEASRSRLEAGSVSSYHKTWGQSPPQTPVPIPVVRACLYLCRPEGPIPDSRVA